MAGLGQREAVRLPLWIASIGAAALTFGVAVLQGAEWRPSLAGVLAGLGPILFGTELARQGVWSPASHQAALDATVTPPDVVPLVPVPLAAWGSPPPPVGE